MHTGLKCAALLLLIAPLGCRSQGELDLAERDMRIQENRIYKLQEYVQQYQQMLEDCQSENDALRKQIAGTGKTPVAASSAKPRTLRELLDSKPTTKSEVSGPDFALPVNPSIDLGTEFNPGQMPAIDKPTIEPAIAPKPTVNPAPNPPGFVPKAATSPAEMPEPDELPEPSSGGAARQEASQLSIRAVGQVRATATMPAGLLIVIEPRSAQGGVARAPAGAKMSLLIVSAANEEPAGRWDYSVEQTSSAYRDGFGGNSGWRFVVPFNKSVNGADQYKLYVRLTLSDGSKLIAERDFDANAGASVEEIPNGDAGWFRSRQPIAALANKLSREARIAFGSGGPPSASRNTAPTFNAGSNASGGGNAAPAWQPQPAGPPSVRMGSASDSAAGSAPDAAGNAAPGWNLAELPTAPEASAVPDPNAAPQPNAAPVAETATRPGRPSWTPYR